MANPTIHRIDLLYCNDLFLKLNIIFVCTDLKKSGTINLINFLKEEIIKYIYVMAYEWYASSSVFLPCHLYIIFVLTASFQSRPKACCGKNYKKK